MDSEAFRKYGKEMIDIVADYWDTLRDRQPLPNVKPGFIWDVVRITFILSLLPSFITFRFQKTLQRNQKIGKRSSKTLNLLYLKIIHIGIILISLLILQPLVVILLLWQIFCLEVFQASDFPG